MPPAPTGQRDMERDPGGSRGSGVQKISPTTRGPQSGPQRVADGERLGGWKDSARQSTEAKGKQGRAMGTEPKAGLTPRLWPATEQAQQENHPHSPHTHITPSPPDNVLTISSAGLGAVGEGRPGVGCD